MALYLGDKKIAGSGSGSNVQVSAVVTEGTHIASISVDNVEKKLYAPVSELDDYATLTGDNDFTGKNTFAAVSAANDFSEETFFSVLQSVELHTPVHLPELSRNDFADVRKKNPALWILQRESFPELKYQNVHRKPVLWDAVS